MSLFYRRSLDFLLEVAVIAILLFVSLVSTGALGIVEAGIVEQLTALILLTLYWLYCKKSNKIKLVTRLKFELIALLALIMLLGVFSPRIYIGENITTDVEGFITGLSITMAFAYMIAFILLIPVAIMELAVLRPLLTSKNKEVGNQVSINLVEIFVVSWFLALFFLTIF